MTQSNQNGQPLTPGTPQYVQHIDAQAARGAWQHQQYEQPRQQQEQQPGPVYVRQQRPARSSRRFPWRVIAWIATGFALLWMVGVVIDAVTGYANPVTPAIFAVGAVAVALVAFIAAPRQRD
jgi:ferric-dicitrate binding protein FerR (iron transport regulator)